ELGNPKVLPAEGPWKDLPFLQTVRPEGGVNIWHLRSVGDDQVMVEEAQMKTVTADGKVFIGGVPHGNKPGERDLIPVGRISKLPGGEDRTGPLGPLSFFSTLQESEVVLWPSKKVIEDDGSVTTVFYQK